jgi:nucleotide-binding universal stress UspA family protein
VEILVPLDGSDLAEGVLPWVRMAVECTGSQVILLRVITYLPHEYLVTDPGLMTLLHETQEAEAKTYVEQVAARLAALGIKVKTEVCTATGSIADTIIDFAGQAGVQMIAMSTHGRTGPARWLLGSVADRVVRGAHCPVLMYRPEES